MDSSRNYVSSLRTGKFLNYVWVRFLWCLGKVLSVRKWYWFSKQELNCTLLSRLRQGFAKFSSRIRRFRVTVPWDWLTPCAAPQGTLKVSVWKQEFSLSMKISLSVWIYCRSSRSVEMTLNSHGLSGSRCTGCVLSCYQIDTLPMRNRASYA